MKVTVKTHHVSITAALKAYAEKKLAKLDKYFDHIVSVTAGLHQIDTAAEDQRSMADIVVKVSGAVLKAEHTSGDMYASIDGIYEKMGVQLKKYKEKLRSHKKSGNVRSVASDSVEKATAKKSKKVVATADVDAKKLVVSKPMSPEDALVILSTEKTPFLLFTNIETHSVNVIYPLKKRGEYGLLEI